MTSECLGRTKDECTVAKAIYIERRCTLARLRTNDDFVAGGDVVGASVGE